MNLKINSVHYISGPATAQMVIAFQTPDGLGRAGERRLMPHFSYIVNPLDSCSPVMDSLHAAVMINEGLNK